jgi:hypothetical protein
VLDFTNQAPLEAGGTYLLAHFLGKYRGNCQFIQITLSNNWVTFDPTTVNVHNDPDQDTRPHFHNPDGVKYLAEILKDDTTIKCLSFGPQWDITADGGYAIGKLLLANETLEEVVLNDITLSAHQLKAPTDMTCKDLFQLGRRVLKDAGAALVAAACNPATTVIDLRNQSVSDAGTQCILREVESGRLPLLQTVNGVSIRELIAGGGAGGNGDNVPVAAEEDFTVANYAGLRLLPTECSFLLKLLMTKTEHLTSLDISSSWVRPTSFKVSPMVYDINRGAQCDGCGKSYSRSQIGCRSTRTDYDLCDCCGRAQSTVSDLIALVQKCPKLKELKLNQIHYGWRFGGFCEGDLVKLGAALARHSQIEVLELSGNYWSKDCPRLVFDPTAWCKWGLYEHRGYSLLGRHPKMILGFESFADSLVRMSNLQQLTIETFTLDVRSLRTGAVFSFGEEVRREEARQKIARYSVSVAFHPFYYIGYNLFVMMHIRRISAGIVYP